jgi:transposase
MSRRRLSVRKIREILRWKWELGRSHRDVAQGLKVSLGKVSSTVGRANALGLTPEEVSELSDDALDLKLYGPRVGPGVTRPPPDYLSMHTELKRKGVTLELLHVEYLESHPDGYRYSRFCELYKAWLKKQRITMRQVHKAGEKMFVDYSGARPFWVDRKTGRRVEGELFVAVLGASNFTFAEVTETQRSPEFIQSHVNAFAYFRGVPEVTVPDQLRSGVSRPCRYEPKIQRTYEEMATHYGTAVIPARPYKAKDKAKAEAGVLVAQRWILARIRKEVHFSCRSVDERVAELLEDLNDREMQGYGRSRRDLYETLERPALQPLPAEAFVYAEWKVARVNIDCHVAADHHYYSAPHSLVHEEVEVRLTAGTVEILHRGQRVASHRRSYVRNGFTTKPEHLPAAHRAHLEWTPSRLIRWGESIGPKTGELVEAILTDRPHPEQGYRSCLGILRLAKRYRPQRLEKACERAVAVGARSYRHVDSILKNGMDRMPLFETEAEPETPPVEHGNIRGRKYYKDKEKKEG